MMNIRHTALLAGISLAFAVLGPSGCGSGNGDPGDPSTTDPVAAAGDDNLDGADAGAVNGSTSRPTQSGVTTSSNVSIAFDTERHDFGSVDDTTELKFSFNFTNTGTETLLIKNVKPSCGCTVARQLEKTSFEPGEGDSIDISFKPKGFGNQSKYIAITTNSQAQTVTKLFISANISPFVRVHPMRSQFGNITQGEEATQIITVLADDPRLQIVSVKSVNRYLTGEVIGPEAVPADAPEAPFRTAIRLKIADNAPWGQFTGKLEINVDGQLPGKGHPIRHSFDVSVGAKVFGAIIADPVFFRISVVPPGDSFEQSIHLEHRNGAPFNVINAAVTNSSMPGVEVEVLPADRNGVPGYDLILTGDSLNYLGRVNGVVTVRTDIVGEQAYRINFYGMVREPGGK